MPTISGTVYDDAGAPAAGRIVRAYRRDTGALLGEAVTSDGLPIAGDPHYANVSLLLHCDGTNGSTTFTDSSPAPKTVTAFGNAKISTAQSRFGGASLSLDGAGDRIAYSDGTGFLLDFTIEAWVRVSSFSTGFTLIDTRAPGLLSGLWFYIKTNGAIECELRNGSAWVGGGGSAAGAIAINTWHHVALTRAASTYSIFIDGVMTPPKVSAAQLTNASVLLGMTVDQSTSWAGNGHLDDIRITKGIARYTANFTPPTAPHYDRLPADATPVGSYSITPVYTGEVQRIVLDDDAGTLYNDLIDRVIVE